MSNEKRIKEIEKELTKLAVFDAVPMLMIALSIHAKFGKSSEPIFEFLENDMIVYGMLAISLPVVFFCLVQVSKLTAVRKRIAAGTDT